MLCPLNAETPLLKEEQGPRQRDRQPRSPRAGPRVSPHYTGLSGGRGRGLRWTPTVFQTHRDIKRVSFNPAKTPGSSEIIFVVRMSSLRFSSSEGPRAALALTPHSGPSAPRQLRLHPVQQEPQRGGSESLAQLLTSESPQSLRNR